MLFIPWNKKKKQLTSHKLLVFQQHKTDVRLKKISKYKNGRERRFCLALPNHISPKTILHFSHVHQSSSQAFWVSGGFCFLTFWLLCNELGVFYK